MALFKPMSPLLVILLGVVLSLIEFPLVTGFGETDPLPKVIGDLVKLIGLIELLALEEEGVRVMEEMALDGEDNTGEILTPLLSLAPFVLAEREGLQEIDLF